MPRLNVQDFLTKFNSELHEHRAEWQSRLDNGATEKSGKVWADGYSVEVTIVENIHDPGWKHHEIRMVIFHEPREPLSVAHWTGEGTERLETKRWQSVNAGDDTPWNTADAKGLTLEQVLSSIKSEFCRTVEADR